MGFYTNCKSNQFHIQQCKQQFYDVTFARNEIIINLVCYQFKYFSIQL